MRIDIQRDGELSAFTSPGGMVYIIERTFYETEYWTTRREALESLHGHVAYTLNEYKRDCPGKCLAQIRLARIEAALRQEV